MVVCVYIRSSRVCLGQRLYLRDFFVGFAPLLVNFETDCVCDFVRFAQFVNRNSLCVFDLATRALLNFIDFSLSIAEELCGNSLYLD